MWLSSSWSLALPQPLDSWHPHSPLGMILPPLGAETTSGCLPHLPGHCGWTGTISEPLHCDHKGFHIGAGHQLAVTHALSLCRLAHVPPSNRGGQG